MVVICTQEEIVIKEAPPTTHVIDNGQTSNEPRGSSQSPLAKSALAGLLDSKIHSKIKYITPIQLHSCIALSPELSFSSFRTGGTNRSTPPRMNQNFRSNLLVQQTFTQISQRSPIQTFSAYVRQVGRCVLFSDSCAHSRLRLPNSMDSTRKMFLLGLRFRACRDLHNTVVITRPHFF